MIGPTDLLHPSPAPHFKTFQALSTLTVYFQATPGEKQSTTNRRHMANEARNIAMTSNTDAFVSLKAQTAPSSHNGDPGACN